jgi:putative phosphoesterase
MRIGLISDTHGDPTAWAKALGVLGDLDLMLHSGDVLYHGIFNPILPTYEPRRLADVLNAFTVPCLHARGNCDSEVDQLALDSHILSDFAFASAEGTRILVCHGHKHTEQELAKLAARGDIQMILRGHTHEPGMVAIEGVTIVNPGSCSLPKQEGQFPTAGLLEEKKITIFDIDSGDVFAEGELPRA